MRLFSLDKMSSAIKEVAILNNIELEVAEKIENCRSRDIDNKRTFRGIVREKRNDIYRSRTLKKSNKASNKKGFYPLKLLLEEDIKIDREKEARELYRNILPLKECQIIIKKIEKLYELDQAIFNEVKSCNKLFFSVPHII